jgi:hypothetical protein
MLRNYLQRFVDTAPDTHSFKNDAKAILAEMKNTEKIVPEKTPARYYQEASVTGIETQTKSRNRQLVGCGFFAPQPHLITSVFCKQFGHFRWKLYY